MNGKNEGVEVLDINIDDLFKDERESPTQKEASTETDGNLTEVMTNRINTVRQTTEKETRDKVAKELGYESYAVMKKSQEDKIAKDAGFNPKDIESVIEPILQKRLEDDPRLKKLEEYEKRERDKYVQEQLASINKTTGQQLKITDLPKETLELWAKGIELEQAYYATQGKTIISKGISQVEQGSLNHLAPGSNAGQIKTRKLTEQEKDMWRSIVPGITEEELAKKTTNI